MLNDFRSAFGNQQLAWVGGHARGIPTDFAWVAHFGYLYHRINTILSNRCREIRETDDRFGQHHHFFSMLGINFGIAE
ncbi:Uncharacterised protein [Vibrio cholerae]|uniref:Uncharacterized protein n=1 Tax=Vibrio cholerae TaxID=666 RepID=A0A655R611_VIBCL|nr:Uncharacterised protein [Vibrio cholerae]CSA80756.1 Uncharacterised protein [Vibrio cholerae]CSA85889.1 Uncharacterised protein [Vibrio cholerae]CSC54783.1 Uncharacterised protein [Vibrio cholerae]